MRSSITNVQGSPSGIELAITSPSGVQPVKSTVTLSWGPGRAVPCRFRQDLPGQSARGLRRLGGGLRDVGGRRRRDGARAPQRLESVATPPWAPSTARRGESSRPGRADGRACFRIPQQSRFADACTAESVARRLGYGGATPNRARVAFAGWERSFSEMKAGGWVGGALLATGLVACSSGGDFAGPGTGGAGNGGTGFAPRRGPLASDRHQSRQPARHVHAPGLAERPDHHRAAW